MRTASAEVYWRRRLLVLAALLLIIWLAVQAYSRFSDETERTAQAGSRPEPTASSATAAPTTPTPTPTDDQERDKTVVTVPVSASKCDIEEIVIKPSVAPDQPVGSAVDVNLNVSTTASTPCELAPSDAQLLAIISANDEAVWDSSVCRASLLDQTVSVSPSWTTVVATEWSGRGSGGNCSNGQPFASPGTYGLKVATLGGEPAEIDFKLAKKPKPDDAEDDAEDDEQAQQDEDPEES